MCSKTDSDTVVQQTLQELARFVDVGHRNERRELAIKIRQRYSEKTPGEITADERLLLQAIAVVYEQQANWAESQRLVEHMVETAQNEESNLPPR
ncbi:hypothetical protein [Halobacterium noricense]|uniref:hypothetical protein n=1 Tax=Halobacterium noricense TaxID=223182 RepID=UPI001E2FE541|nr:hypothetical protein [Halobacterium noricense]UHH24188.1 hypothetical protein LT974_09300 [Halobacterium noricense]